MERERLRKGQKDTNEEGTGGKRITTKKTKGDIEGRKVTEREGC